MIRRSSVLTFLFLSVLVGCIPNHEVQRSYRFNEMPLVPIEGTEPIREPETPLKVTRQTLSEGRALFDMNCALCHGLDGSGDSLPVRRGLTQPPPLYEVVPAGPGYFYDVITYGKGRMIPLRRKLSPLERRKVVAYLEALRISRKIPLEKLDPEDQEKFK